MIWNGKQETKDIGKVIEAIKLTIKTQKKQSLSEKLLLHADDNNTVYFYVFTRWY